MISYKWERFAKNIHWFGWFIHMLYIIAVQMYITQVYLIDDPADIGNVNFEVWLNVIGGCLLYPTIYDGR